MPDYNRKPSVLSPDHFVDYARIGLNDFHYLCGNIFLCVIGNGNSVISVFVQCNCRIHRLQKGLFVDSRKDKTCLVESFRALGARSDTHCRERVLKPYVFYISVMYYSSYITHQLILRYVVKEFLKVNIHDPYVTIVEVLKQFRYCLLTSSIRSETVAVLIEHRVKYGCQSLLLACTSRCKPWESLSGLVGNYLPADFHRRTLICPSYQEKGYRFFAIALNVVA